MESLCGAWYQKEPRYNSPRSKNRMIKGVNENFQETGTDTSEYPGKPVYLARSSNHPSMN